MLSAPTPLSELNKRDINSKLHYSPPNSQSIRSLTKNPAAPFHLTGISISPGIVNLPSIPISPCFFTFPCIPISPGNYVSPWYLHPPDIPITCCTWICHGIPSLSTAGLSLPLHPHLSWRPRILWPPHILRDRWAILAGKDTCGESLYSRVLLKRNTCCVAWTKSHLFRMFFATQDKGYEVFGWCLMLGVRYYVAQTCSRLGQFL